MREELLKKMYSYLVNEHGLSEEISDIFDSIVETVEQLSNTEEAELIADKLVNLEHAVFLLGANSVLDFIAGREVA